MPNTPLPIEKPLVVETLPEVQTETISAEVKVDKPISKPEEVVLPTMPTDQQAPTSVVSYYPQKKEIEDVMAEGMEEAFKKMSPATRERFKFEGERSAAQIFELYRATKATAQKILDIIRKWLGMIPGVNRFFLEQEAKIKTDKIMNLKKLE